MNERIDVITQAAKKAGEEMLKHDPETVDMELKSSEADMVTAADLACEKVISDIILASFPNNLVITEETAEGHIHLTAENLPNITAWIVDPIDGTNNFKKGMDYSAVSIGYVENGEPVLAAVYDPFRKELYLAQKGKGVSRNGKPIKLADKSKFDPGTRVCTCNTYEIGGTEKNLSRYKSLGHVWVDVLGCAVLAMTDVACGRLDLFHHAGLKPWDNAAVLLIAHEAGAKITNLKGEPTNFLSNEVVVGNPALVDKFIKLTAS